MWGLIEVRAAAGIYHWTDLGVASWYDFAVAIQEEALARGLLKRAVADRADRDRGLSDARPAPRVQRAGYRRRPERWSTTAPAVHWRHNLRTMLDELRAA